MLPILVFLEHHYDNTTRDFLTKYMKEFKALGYGIALEVSVDVNLHDFIRMSQESIMIQKSNLKKPNPNDKKTLEIQIVMLESFVRFCEAILASGIYYECIDMKETKAPRLGQALLGSPEREEHLIKNILQMAKRLEGRVIYHGGFKHNLVVDQLARRWLVQPEVILMFNPIIFPTLFKLRDYQDDEKRVFEDPAFCNMVYGQEVHRFTKELTFTEFDARLKLTNFDQEVSDSQRVNEVRLTSALSSLPTELVQQITKLGLFARPSQEPHQALVEALLQVAPRTLKTESVFKSIDEKNYNQAVRRACTVNDEISNNVLKVLLKFKDILSIDINEVAGEKKVTALALTVKNGNKIGYEMLIQAGAEPLVAMTSPQASIFPN